MSLQSDTSGNVPAGRQSSVVAYHGGTLIMFGGYQTTNNPPAPGFNDLWEATFICSSPAPPAFCAPVQPPTPDAFCNGTHWVVNGSLSVTSLVINAASSVVIQGNFTVLAGGSVAIIINDAGSVPLQVQGNTQISPEDTSLNVTLLQLPPLTNNVLIIHSTEGYNGSFASAVVVPGQYCPQQQVAGQSLSVLLSDDCGSGSLAAPKIAGIVAGSIVGAALLLFVVVYVARYVLRKRWTDTLFRPADVPYTMVEQDDST